MWDGSSNSHTYSEVGWSRDGGLERGEEEEVYLVDIHHDLFRVFWVVSILPATLSPVVLLLLLLF